MYDIEKINYYEIQEKTSTEDAKLSFIKKYLDQHPDASEQEKKYVFERIDEAHRVLNNPEEKTKYDILHSYISITCQRNEKHPS